MRILIHDYGGYAFTVQLARELACRGHTVNYLYGESTQFVKRGDFELHASDPAGLSITGITLSQPFQKYSWWKRRAQEIEYGHLLAKNILDWRPEVVISGNTPLDTQALSLKAGKSIQARYVFWLQDVIGLATYKILKQKSPLLGYTVGNYYTFLEKHLLRQSDYVVLISQDFQPLLHRWGIPDRVLRVVPNWAALNEISPGRKDNPWAIKHGLQEKFCFLYSGVLGMKHNPDLILQLAIHWQEQPEVRVVVISEGPGADWLQSKKAEYGLDDLLVLNFQDHADFPDVLASADVLIALLEADAGIFSVPSKVLTYLCAERPLLLAVPPENLAARVVAQKGAGVVVHPSDVSGFICAAETLFQEEALRRAFARNARTYAELNFDIEKIANQFEEVLLKEKRMTSYSHDLKPFAISKT